MTSKYFNNTYVTAGYTLATATTSVTIGSTGTIGGPGISTNHSATITNAGTVHGTRYGFQSVSAASSGTVSNSGVIEGYSLAGIGFVGSAPAIITNTTTSSVIEGGGFGIRLKSSGTITNHGTILATGRSYGSLSSSSAIQIYGGVIQNLGSASLIEAAQPQYAAITDKTGGISLTNQGTIIGSISLNGAAHIYNQGPAAVMISSYGKAFAATVTVGSSSTVINSGLIENSYNLGIAIYGHNYSSLDNTGTIIGGRDAVLMGGMIKNYGEIYSRYKSNFGFSGIAVDIEGGTLINESTGILIGAVGGSPSSIINYGTISGYCSCLPGVTTSQISNHNLITGNIYLNNDSGSSTILNFGTVGGTISAGGNAVSNPAMQAYIDNAGLAADLYSLSLSSSQIINSGVVLGGVQSFSRRGSAIIVNTGTILGSASATGAGYVQAIIFNSGTIEGTVNTARGTIVDEAGSVFGGQVYGSTLLLAGYVGVMSGLGTQFGRSAYNFTNVEVQAGGSWSFYGVNAIAAGALLANYGTLVSVGPLLDNGLVTLFGSSTLFGSISGSGTLLLASGSTNIYESVLGVSSVTMSGGVATLDSYVTVSGTFSQSGGTIALPASGLTLEGNASFTGGTIQGGGSLYTRPVYTSPFYVGGTNTSGGYIGGTYVQGGYTGGTIGVSNLVLDEGATWQDSGTITQTGVLSIGVGTGDTAGLVIDSYGVLNVSGTVSGTGSLQIAGGYTVLESGAVLTIANLDISSGTLKIAHSVANAGTFAESGGIVEVSTNVLTLNGAASFTGGIVAGPGTSIGTGYLTTEGATTLTALTLGGNAIWQVFGTTTATGTLTEGDASGDHARLSIFGTYALSGAVGVAVASGASGIVVVNAGGVLDKASGISVISVSFTDAGTVAFTSGTVDLDAATTFSGGTVTGAGYIVTNAAAALSALVVTGGAIWQVFGTTTVTGNLTLGDASGGAGRLSVFSGGTYDITGNDNIAVAAGGSGSVSNAGLFEKTGGTGLSLVQTTLANTGTLLVSAGTVEISGNLSGGGSATIGVSGTLKLDAASQSTQTIDFAGSTGGELVLNDPSGSGLSFASLVAGFAGSDLIDLPTFAYNAGATVGWTQNGSQGTLTVTDGSKTASIALFGQYVTAGFALAEDSTGGTLIEDPPVPGHHHHPVPAVMIAVHH